MKHKYILSKYGFAKDTPRFADHEEFLVALARKSGKLRKGGEPDVEIVARSVLYDWQRGRPRRWSGSGRLGPPRST